MTEVIWHTHTLILVQGVGRGRQRKGQMKGGRKKGREGEGEGGREGKWKQDNFRYTQAL